MLEHDSYLTPSSIGFVEIVPLFLTGLVLTMSCFAFSQACCNRAVTDPPKSAISIGASEIAAVMKQRAAAGTAFTETELDALQTPLMLTIGQSNTESLNWSLFRKLMGEVAHRSHKDWAETEAGANRLEELVGNPGNNPNFRKMFDHVLASGHWDRAYEHASARKGNTPNRFAGESPVRRIKPKPRGRAVSPAEYVPWVVVIAGVNGIRKTTSVYKPWFRQVLFDALGDSFKGDFDNLPTGGNSFFRQLDFIMATVGCMQFKTLYETVEVDNIDDYANLKSAIFARHRMIAEMVGVILLKKARDNCMNIMIETSGRDIATLNYVDYLFPDSGEGAVKYNKLLVHFTINNIQCAESSISTRMKAEMRDGQQAIALLQQGRRPLSALSLTGIIKVNRGGPYGPNEIRNVQRESDAVINSISPEDDCSLTTTTDGKNISQRVTDHPSSQWSKWFKARIDILATDTSTGWKARAQPNGTVFEFDQSDGS